jgi:hypothetical protein
MSIGWGDKTRSLFAAISLANRDDAFLRAYCSVFEDSFGEL